MYLYITWSDDDAVEVDLESSSLTEQIEKALRSGEETDIWVTPEMLKGER